MTVEVISPAETVPVDQQVADQLDAENSGRMREILEQGRLSANQMINVSRDIALLQRGLDPALDLIDIQKQAFQRLKAGVDGEQEINSLKNQYIMRFDENLTQIVRKTATDVDPDVRQTTADLLTGREEHIQAQIAAALEYDGTANTIKELYSDPSVDDLTKRRQRQAYANISDAQKWADQFGFVSDTSDFVAMMVAPDTWKDRFDLTGKVSKEQLSQDIQTYQSLDPEEQAIVWPDLFEGIKDTYDNNVWEVMNVVATLHARDFAQDLILEDIGGAVEAVFTPADVLLAGKAIKGAVSSSKVVEDFATMKNVETAQPRVPTEVQAINEVGKQQSVPHQMMQVRNEQAAAESMTAAGMDAEVAKMLGVAQQDAAMTASPFRNSELPIINGSVDTIADSMVKLHRAQVEEHVIAQRIAGIQQTRAGDNAVLSAAHKRTITLPRRIERLKKDIKVMERNLRKLKKQKAPKSKINTLDGALNLSVQKLAVASRRLRNAEETIATTPKIDRLDEELITLASGRIPTNLTDEINNVISSQSQRKLNASNRASKTEQMKNTLVEDLPVTVDKEALKIVQNSELAKSAERLLSDRIRYGLSDDYANDLEESIVAPLRQLVEETNSLSIDKFTEVRKKEIQDKVVANILKEGKSAGREVKVGEIIPQGDEGFRVLYRTNDTDEVFEYQYSLSDTGVFEGAGIISDRKQGLLDKILSPSTLFNDLGRFVNNLTFAGDQAAKIGVRLQRMHQDIHSGLSAAQRRELDGLLTYGDEQGRVFTIEELQAGLVETAVSHKSHDAATVDAYYRMRVFYDELHDMRDYFTRKELNFAGYRDVSYTDKEGEIVQMIGKPLDDFRGVDTTDQNVIFVPGQGDELKQYVSMTDIKENFKAWKDSGYRLVEMHDPHINRVNGKTKNVRFAMIEDGNGATVTALPSKVLGYIPGYIPRVYKSGYHFVKDVSNPTRPITAFVTETRDDAVRFADQLNGFAGGDKYLVKADREMTAAERLIADADSYGGLYTSGRSSRDLMVRTVSDTEPYRPERVGSGEATSRYLSNISSFMPLAEYRLSLMKQWMNTVEHLAQQSKGGARIGLKDKRDFNSEVDLAPDQKAYMEAARDYLKSQLNMSDDSEKLWANKLTNISDVLYDGNKSKAKAHVRSMVRGMIDKDPVQQLKGLTFNAQLGMFNVRQLIVQSQNAFIAASVDPLNAPAALRDALAMRTFVLASDNQIDGLIPVVSRLTGYNVDELRDLAKGFKETGLWDSIKRDADFDANVTTVGGGTLASVRKVASTGRFFFREGELMSRLVSYSIARRRLGPGATTQEIFDEHLRLSMNMQSANAAMWQKNWMGVPLQYMQVFAKFYENLIPGLLYNKGKWSRREAAQIAVGQFALYGTIGIPVAQDAYAYVADFMGITPEEAKENMPWIEDGIEEGMVGLFGHVLGFDNNFSESLSILGGTAESSPVELSKSLWQAFVEGRSDVDFGKALYGPSLAPLTKTADATMSMFHAARVLMETPSVEVMGGQVLKVADKFAGITSSWSNARKAIFLHDLGLLSKQSNTIVGAQLFSDVNIQTLFGQAMGFQTDIEQDYWALKDTNRSTRQRQKEDLAAMKSVHTEFMKTGNIKDYKAEMALLRMGKTEAEWMKLLESVLRGQTGQSDYDRQAQSYFNNYILSGGREVLHPATKHIGE